jgi:MFS family permease
MKNKGAFVLLFSANSISGVAQGICMIAIPWHLTSTLNMPTMFGTLYASLTFMALFWGLLVGTLVDKYNRKNIFLAISTLGGGALLSIACLGFFNDGLHYIYAIVVFALTYFIYSVHYPTLYAFAQEISEPKNYGRITSYIEIQGQVTNMFGGACAAILLTGVSSGSKEVMGYVLEMPFSIEKWELHQIFLLDGITYVIAVLLITCIKYERIADFDRDAGSILERIKFGFSYLKNNRVIFIFGVASFTVFVSVLVLSFYLAPIYITRHLHAGAGTYATADMFFALGAVLAGAGINWVFHRLNSVQVILLLSTMTAGIYVLCMYNTNVIVFYALMLLIGLSNAGIRITRITYLLQRIPNAVIGRAASVFGMANVLMRVTLISLFAIPVFVESNNIIYTFLILGVFILAFNVPLVLYYKAIEKGQH